MTSGTFITGGTMTLTGVVAYVAAGPSSVTALIPAAFGALMLVLGFISLKPRAFRHAIHLALLVAVIGIARTSQQVLKLGELFAGTGERPLAVIASAVTFATLAICVVVGVMSFIRARRYRRGGTSPDAQ